MIGHFVKPHHRHDLAHCAVIFPLAMGLSILLPLAAYGIWASWLPPFASGWTRGLPFWLWMAWVVAQWITLVRLIRAAGERSNAVGVFHRIQGCALLLAAAHLCLTGGRIDRSFFTIWTVCVETAMIVFYINYFLLALWTQTRVSWHAVAGFVVVVGALALEIWLSNQPAH